MPATALVTGFAPYGGRGVNPAAEIARRLDGAVIGGVGVVGRTFPVSLRSLRQNLDQAFAEVDPVVVVGVGLWPGEPMIRLERIGINIADFEIPDNEGALPAGAPVEAQGTTARLATLPLRAIETALLAAGIPARLSATAGTYLCNATLYTALSCLEAEGREVPCGFIHVPYLPEQVAAMIVERKETRSLELHQRSDLASMGLETMTAAVRIALEVTLGHG